MSGGVPPRTTSVVGSPTEGAALTLSIEVIHATVPGRLRVRIGALRGRQQLKRELEQKWATIHGVHSATGNVRTASVLVLFDVALGTDALLEQLAQALSEVASAEQPPVPAWSFVETLPVGEARLDDVLGRVAQVYRRLLPALRTSDPSKGGRAGRRSATAAAVMAGMDAANGPVWHALGVAEVFELWRSEARGLGAEEVTRRRAEHGPNLLPVPEPRAQLEIFLAQFRSVPVAMLGASAVLSVATGGLADAVAIVAVLLVNASIGYLTESNAERIISSLSRVEHPPVEVIRDGERQRTPADAVVPGDVLLVSTGTSIPADARLLETDGLVVDESALTGESMPVRKHAGTLAGQRIPLADRLNMVFRGTLVTGGSGVALVVGTGLATQIGQVQSLVGGIVQRETPLQKQLKHLGVQLAVGAGCVCGGVFAIGLARGYPLARMLSTAVSLAVAAIPEGLPTVAITTLALGIRHMQERKVLVRQLNAVETLGAISVMCLDKTGTITVNRMTVVALYAGMRDLRADQLIQQVPNGSLDGIPSDALELLRVGVLCSEVEIETTGGVHVLRGSPTEAALVQLAIDAELDIPAIRADNPLLATQYRSETRSYMATLHRPALELPKRARVSTEPVQDAAVPPLLVAVKGRSPEVLAMCSHYLREGCICELGDADRASIEVASERMAGQALRVLGFAFARRENRSNEGPAFTIEGARDLVWLGLVGMSDPPREGMREILARFHSAGVRTVMITGDQSATAHAIGKAIGLSSDGLLQILDSTELEGMAPDVLRSLVERVHIFSRVSPAHKLKIVQALQAAGKIVAMTGDGINDSPALKAADVGVAMGMSGTSAAREVADVILQDDNLETMITGIEQGRAIYDDIKKAVHFILSTNISEILITFMGILTRAGDTLTPMQLLWINLMTDIFPELALAVQPPEGDVLKRPPRDPERSMFERADLARVAVEGGILTAGAFGAYTYGLLRYGAGPRAGTLRFTVLTVAQLLHVISSRSETHGIFDQGHLAPNKYIPMALGGGLALQLMATLIPGLRRVLGVVPLGFADWGVVGLSAAGTLLANESLKLVLRKPQLVVSPETQARDGKHGS